MIWIIELHLLPQFRKFSYLFLKGKYSFYLINFVKYNIRKLKMKWKNKRFFFLKFTLDLHPKCSPLKCNTNSLSFSSFSQNIAYPQLWELLHFYRQFLSDQVWVFTWYFGELTITTFKWDLVVQSEGLEFTTVTDYRIQHNQRLWLKLKRDTSFGHLLTGWAHLSR